MVKKMLKVLMDEIKDSNMILDYYEETDDPQVEEWFRNWSKKKLENAMNMFSFIENNIHLEQKAKQGDELAEALFETLESDLKILQNRFK